MTPSTLFESQHLLGTYAVAGGKVDFYYNSKINMVKITQSYFQYGTNISWLEPVYKDEITWINKSKHKFIGSNGIKFLNKVFSMKAFL